MSQIVQLSFLSEKEEKTILTVIEEDLKLQKEEEKRVQKLRDDIASLTVKCRKYARTFCACCGVLFCWIFDSGKMCQACSQWICKRDRIHCSDNNQWICKLCNFRMVLYINEHMLSVSLDPSNVLCVSFNTRDGETEQGFHYKQQNYLRPKEETEQDYHNQEMLQQATGEESEEDKKDNGDEEKQPPQQNTHIPAIKCVDSNVQGTTNLKEKGAVQTQQQQQQSLEVQPVTGRCSQSPKKLMFREKSSIIAIPPSFLRPIISGVIDTQDDDDGVAEIIITADNDDSSSSSGDDGETSDEDQKRNTSKQPKPILVYPSSTDDGEETISLMFPPKSEKKASFELDDYDFRALTKENTVRNRANITSSLSLLDYDDDGVYKTDSLNSSMSDVRSVYSGSVMYTHDEVTGEIQMGVSYSDTDNALKVSINKVRGLTPPNKIDENHTNPYVKTYLLPDQSKSTKKKTSVKKGVDPIFNETIKYPIKRQELSKHTLKVGVWHNDFWRHNLFLGEVTLPLDKVDWSNPSDKWYGLEELSHDDTGQLTDRGQLKVSLQFNITNDKKQIGDLVVTIISGHNLLQTELTCNPVVKCHLLPDYRKKFKTKVLKDNSNPEWNEQFVFDHIKLEDLRENRVIELTVWNSTKNTKHYDFIGGLRLGPHPHHKKQLIYMDSSENELSHWMSIVNTPGECVEQLHTLRHNMDPLHMGVTSQQKVTSQHSLKTACKTPSSDGLDSGNNRMVVCSSRQLVDTPVHIGQVRVMLQYVPAVADTSKSGKEKCYFKVWIRQASGLKTHYDNGSFVLCTLLPKGKHQKFKSPVIENDENSVYNAKFQFDKVTDVELSYDRVLEITIWEPHRNTNEFVGGIRLGPRPQPGNKNKWMDSVGSEVNQWEIMMARPKEWIDEWHPLRLLNKPQNI